MSFRDGIFYYTGMAVYGMVLIFAIVITLASVVAAIEYAVDWVIEKRRRKRDEEVWKSLK